MHRVLLSSMIGLLGLPAVAWADSFVIAPLLSPDVEASHNVTSLISAELDFQPMVDDLSEIGTPPSSSGCLASSSCLAGLAREGGGDKLITGSLATSSTVYTIDLVYFDAAASRTIRRDSFSLEASPEAIADGMTAVIREILTGKAPAEEEAEEPTADDFDFSGSDDDGFAFEDDFEDDSDAAERRAEEEARRRAEAERRRRAEEEARQAEEEARRRAEAERRRRAEEERRRRAEEERRRRAEEERREAEARRSASADDDFDPDAISFSSASGEMRVESADEISFAPAAGEASEGLDDDYDFGSVADLDDEPIEDLDGPIEDLDGPVDRSRRDRDRRSSTRSRTRARQPADNDAPSVSITARGGYSRYFKLNFITYGGEVAVPLGRSGLHVLGGVEAYSVNRTLPDDIAEQIGRETAWDTIFPFNAGLTYKFGQGTIVPYIGADAIFGQYFVDPESDASSWTLGGRARTGADFMVSDLFGINVNLAVGAWHGDKWTAIDTGMQNTGLLPQLSAGTVFDF